MIASCGALRHGPSRGARWALAGTAFGYPV